MAQESKRRIENVEGNFFVDETCIDCDTCRWMAPETFEAIGDRTAVYQQPESSEAAIKATQALLSCPTASIGYLGESIDIDAVIATLPIELEDCVYHNGFHSPKSYGAASYFIKRDAGNILVDSPRFTPGLVKRFEEMGGIRYMFLTHKDDVADHQKFHDHFNCERIIHKLELSDSIPTAEIIIENGEPSSLDGADDLLMIPTPGHTAGHMVLNYRPEGKGKFLFAGDHLSYSSALQHMKASKAHCWYSWEDQIKSVEALASYDWSWLLPGHGRPFKASPEKFKSMTQSCAEWMKTV